MFQSITYFLLCLLQRLSMNKKVKEIFDIVKKKQLMKW